MLGSAGRIPGGPQPCSWPRPDHRCIADAGTHIDAQVAESEADVTACKVERMHRIGNAGVPPRASDPTGQWTAPIGASATTRLQKPGGGRRGAEVSCCFQRRACSEASFQLAIRRALQPAQSRSAVRRAAITAAARREVFGAASFRIVSRLPKPAFGVGAHSFLVHLDSGLEDPPSSATPRRAAVPANWIRLLLNTTGERRSRERAPIQSLYVMARSEA
jgi:hypothetical protein